MIGPGARDRTGFDAGKKAKGHKRRLLCGTLGLLMCIAVFPAGVQDRNGAARLFGRIVARSSYVERFFACVTPNRRLAEDFKRFAATVQTLIRIAMIKLMPRCVACYPTYRGSP